MQEVCFLRTMTGKLENWIYIQKKIKQSSTSLPRGNQVGGLPRVYSGL